MYPLVVKLYDVTRGGMLKILAYVPCFWLQCARHFYRGFQRRHYSLNMGRHNGLYKKFESKNECVYTFGCPCHIIHNTASHASKEFAGATGFDVSDYILLFWQKHQTTSTVEGLLSILWPRVVAAQPYFFAISLSGNIFLEQRTSMGCSFKLQIMFQM